MGRVIVIEDNIIYSDFVCRLLESKGYPSVSTSTCNSARKLFAKMQEDDIVLADLRLPDGNGIALLEELRKQGRNNPYVVMTDYDEVPTAVRSMKSGAEDYIPKKLLEDSLFPLLKTLRKRMERHEAPIYERQSAAFREIDHKIRLIAPTNMSVLILGESGTGKEHIAEKIHARSKRAGKPFVAVDCGLLSKELAASTLFGHEKGAFTGAIGERKGYFGEADGGTIFLDEVGELPLPTQARLLRVLESGEFIKVGSSKVQKTDVRIVAATNVNLTQAIAEGRFREDLYYRLNTVPIQIPPLRERGDDVLLLFRKFAADFAAKYRMPAIQLTEDAKKELLAYPWPGNVRQLKNITEQISIIETNREITAAILQTYLPAQNVQRLPALLGTRESKSFESEREILYSVLFDMRQEVAELRKMVHNMMAERAGQVAQMGQVGQVVATPVVTTANQPSVPAIIHPMQQATVCPKDDDDDIQDTEEYVEENLALDEVEKEMIRKALEKHHGKRKGAARDLKISERTLYRKIKEYELD